MTEPKLDFSEFHPLFHWAFSYECFGWYGGPITHIKAWWAYQTNDWLHPRRWRGLIACKLGRHPYDMYWDVPRVGNPDRAQAMDDFTNLTNPSGYSCPWCGSRKETP